MTIAKADNVTIPDITLPAGGTATMSIELNNTEKDYSAFQFYFSLPEGVSVVMENNKMKYELGERLKDTGFTVSTTTTASGNYFVLGYYIVTQPIPEHSGAIITFTLQADEDVASGTLQGQLYDSSFTTTTAEKNVYDCSFNINIVDYITLDENSTTPPTTAYRKNVVVKRTINAGSWSTICLPFAMTEEQCKEAFGQGVKIADFMGTESEYDDDDNVVGIKANFQSVTSMEDNHPYIIKVEENLTEFTINGVDIDPDEGACKEFDNGKTGARRIVYSGFYGTYVANTLLDEFTLFLSGNKFYYSAGKTKMKAFRAFFDFLDILTDVKDNAGAKIAFLVDKTPASIEGLATNGTISNGAVYTVGGQLIGRNVDERQLKKGVYIRNGKKFVVK